MKIAEKCKSQTGIMTKANLITVIADKLKFPWARAELLVDVVFGSMEQSMSRGEKIEVRATRPNYPYTQHLRRTYIHLFTTPICRTSEYDTGPPPRTGHGAGLEKV